MTLYPRTCGDQDRVVTDYFVSSRHTTADIEKKIEYDTIYLSIAIGLTPGGSDTVHIYTQTTHRATQLTTKQHE
jgi:hypothetical protein